MTFPTQQGAQRRFASSIFASGLYPDLEDGNPERSDRIVISSAPWVSPSTVKRVWEIGRGDFVAENARAYAVLSLEQLRFVIERSPVETEHFDWRSIEQSWLREHPTDRYGNGEAMTARDWHVYHRNFRKDVLKTRSHIFAGSNGNGRSDSFDESALKEHFTVKEFYTNGIKLFVGSDHVPF